MKLKKSKLIIIICALFAMLFLIRIVTNAPFFLERKIDSTKHNFKEYINAKPTDITQLAELIIHEAESSGVCLTHNQHSSNFPAKLKQNLQSFLKAAALPIDEVYVGNPSYIIYPQEACIFRSTVRQGNGVYAWVDLVYTTDFAGMNKEWYASFETLTDNWYLVVFYGY